MKTSVSEPWCRSARLDMNHDGTPSGSRAQVLTPTQVKDKKLGHVFAHVWAEIQEYVFKAKTGTGLSNCFDGVQTPKQPKHENYLITSSGRQQDFFSSSFITYFLTYYQMMDETTESSSRREKTKQNIMTKGCAIILFGDFVIYERTLSRKRELKTVKFPEWRNFSR